MLGYPELRPTKLLLKKISMTIVHLPGNYLPIMVGWLSNEHMNWIDIYMMDPQNLTNLSHFRAMKKWPYLGLDFKLQKTMHIFEILNDSAFHFFLFSKISKLLLKISPRSTNLLITFDRMTPQKQLTYLESWIIVDFKNVHGFAVASSYQKLFGFQSYSKI